MNISLNCQTVFLKFHYLFKVLKHHGVFRIWGLMTLTLGLVVSSHQSYARNVDVKVLKIIQDQDNTNYVTRAKSYSDHPNLLFTTSRGSDELGNHGRLSIFDLSKPEEPKRLSSWKPESLDNVELPTAGTPLAITVGNSTNSQFVAWPYLKNVMEGQDKYKDILIVLSIYTGTVHLLDVSDPAKPVEKGNLSIGGFISIPFMQLLHVKVYVTDDKQYALVTSPQRHSLIAIDITDPEHPDKIAEVDLGFSPLPDGEGAEGIYIHDHYAYCGAFHGSKLVVVDLSQIGHKQLKVVKSLDDKDYDQMVSMIEPRDEYNNLLYSAGWGSPGGLLVFDLAEPANPVEIARVVKPELSKANRVKLWNNFAFLPQEAVPGTLGIVDVTDPKKPELIKVIPKIADDHGQVINHPYAMMIKSHDDKSAYAYIFGATDSNMAILQLTAD
ncbi:LVIVD repeat-containing protein [Endozoicomonas numazuensis]|uniref:Uncharacterized protein n=1 Tax=Endozoicomonas numazuensis TaxID=1137799 RepID=A0A081NIL3_9GAMM|nr:hypothetical protein [Endozoicomonas numazuensis]KEQ18286.1 hypothetical protein GZ78_12245 [Endozoicomonas numazuensis]